MEGGESVRRYWRRRRNVASCLHRRKSLLAHKDETLEYKRQLAALGDKVTYQERLNALAQQADKFAQQQRAKRAAIDAKKPGLTDRQAERGSHGTAPEGTVWR